MRILFTPKFQAGPHPLPEAPVLFPHTRDAGIVGQQSVHPYSSSPTIITEINKTQFALFGIQNRVFRTYITTNNRILVTPAPVLHPPAQNHCNE
jgi:hypothetical protein